MNSYGTLTSSTKIKCETVKLKPDEFISSIQFQYGPTGVNRMVFATSIGDYRIAGDEKPMTYEKFYRFTNQK